MGKRIQRGPDLPNAGYSTLREKCLSDAMMLVIRDWERNERVMILQMAIEGYEAFVQVAKPLWSPWGVTDDQLKAAYRYIVWTAGADPMTQLANLLKIRPKVQVN